MQPGQHGGALTRQMLLDAGAEAEMRPLGIEQHRAELAVAEMLRQRLRRAPRSWRHRPDWPSAG